MLTAVLDPLRTAIVRHNGRDRVAFWQFVFLTIRGEGTGLHLLAPVADCYAELPALEAHQHAPQFVPRHFLTVDNEQRNSAILRLIPFDSAAYHLVGDLRALLAAHEMLDGQTSAHPLDQTARQRHWFVVRFPDYLELISPRRTGCEFEGVECRHRPEQPHPEMELVPLPCAVSHHNRMERDILEALQTQSAGHLGVEAAVAKLSVTCSIEP